MCFHPAVTVPRKKDSEAGYTLLEVVVALTILTAVAVPLFTMMSRTVFIGDTRRELCGMWLCAQEAECINAFPERSKPVTYRYIDGKEWFVKVVTTGTNPVRYELAAGRGGNVTARLVFYGRSAHDNH